MCAESAIISIATSYFTAAAAQSVFSGYFLFKNAYNNVHKYYIVMRLYDSERRRASLDVYSNKNSTTEKRGSLNSISRRSFFFLRRSDKESIEIIRRRSFHGIYSKRALSYLQQLQYTAYTQYYRAERTRCITVSLFRNL